MERRKLTRVAGLLVGGLMVTGASLAASPMTAQAAESTVNDVTLAWGLNKESGGGAYFGGCNFLVAGAVGNTGSSHVWTEAEGFYKATDGNVTIVKDGVDGQVTPTFATKCQDGAGKAVTTAAASSTNNQVVFSHGTGTVDPAKGTASISWTGDFTVVFYGGLTYWTASNPVLTVDANGTGSLTATVGGYAASMEDSTVWSPLTPRVVHLANLSNVSVTDQGVTVTPDYLGVTATGVTNQITTGSTWGSFPSDFVAFQQETGQSSYWYSSGGASDPRKVTSALTVGWTLPTTPDPDPEPSAKGDVDVNVTVPTPAPVVGALKLSVSGTANLGEATATDAGFTATGALPNVTVTDTREGGSWTVNGQLGTFTSPVGEIPASALGWAPKLVSGDAQLGASVNGLATSATLASGTKGEATLGATLNLVAPSTTQAGDYTATLTLTALG